MLFSLAFLQGVLLGVGFWCKLEMEKHIRVDPPNYPT